MTAVPATASPDEVEDVPPGSARRALVLTAVYYVLGALAVTLWLWRHPGTATVAGNPNDADQFAWFFRYDATAIAHGRLPALVTTALNAPQGVSVMWNTFMLLPGVLLTPLTLLAGPAGQPHPADDGWASPGQRARPVRGAAAVGRQRRRRRARRARCTASPRP